MGVAGSQIDGDNHRGYFKGGLNVGAWVRHMAGNNAGWQMEIKYTGKGARGMDSLNYYLVSLKYVELPVMYFNQFNPKYSFQIGASAGYLFNGYYSGYSINKDASLSTYLDQDITANLGKVDICAIAGFSYHLSEKVTFNLRITRSITPVYHVSGGTAVRPWDRNTYNNTLALAIYYRMGV